MSVWDRFGIRYYLCYAKDGGVVPFCREMARVGLDAMPVPTADSVFDDVLLKSVRCAGNMRKAGMNITLGHYTAVRHAYDRGAESVLGLETDVRFRRDVSAVCASVAALPGDFDVALFDWALPKGGFEAAGVGNSVDGWARFGCVRSCGCWALSRRGMACWLGMVEAAAGGGKMRVCDMYHGMMVSAGMVGYCAVPPVCVQTEHAGSNTSYAVIRGRYEAAGVDLADYGA